MSGVLRGWSADARYWGRACGRLGYVVVCRGAAALSKGCPRRAGGIRAKVCWPGAIAVVRCGGGCRGECHRGCRGPAPGLLARVRYRWNRGTVGRCVCGHRGVLCECWGEDFEDLVIPWPYMRLGSEDSGVDRWISTPLATSALILSPDYFAYLPCRCHTYHTYIIVPHHHT